MMIVCLTQTFTQDDRECLTVALLLAQGLRDLDAMPCVSSDHGMVLARKVMIALSFFRAAMERRHARRAAPEIDFYRRASQAALCRSGYEQLAHNHSRWEDF